MGIDEKVSREMNRRDFLKSVGTFGAAIVLQGCSQYRPGGNYRDDNFVDPHGILSDVPKRNTLIPEDLVRMEYQTYEKWHGSNKQVGLRKLDYGEFRTLYTASFLDYANQEKERNQRIDAHRERFMHLVYAATFKKAPDMVESLRRGQIFRGVCDFLELLSLPYTAANIVSTEILNGTLEFTVGFIPRVASGNFYRNNGTTVDIYDCLMHAQDCAYLFMSSIDGANEETNPSGDNEINLPNLITWWPRQKWLYAHYGWKGPVITNAAGAADTAKDAYNFVMFVKGNSSSGHGGGTHTGVDAGVQAGRSVPVANIVPKIGGGAVFGNGVISK